MKALLKRREMGVALIIFVLGTAVALYSPAFLTVKNILNILINNTPLAIAAIGMTFVIITGGIDDSVAGQMMISAMVLAYAVFMPWCNPFIAIIISIACGLITGTINGLLIALFDVPPLILTIGTNSMMRGIILVVTNGKWIMGLPAWFVTIGKPANGFPSSILYALLLFVAGSWILKYTKFGRCVFAVGGNREAARRVGINIKKTLILTYTLSGACSGFAGLLLLTILGNFQPSGSMGLEMNAIAAAVIGGTNINGGAGTLAGTALGVILMGLIENSLVVAHIPSYYQKMVYGLIIIVAVSVDVISKNKADSKRLAIDVRGEKGYE